MFSFSGHIIKPNHWSTIPTNMIFYDSETTYTEQGEVQYHTLDFGWVNHCRYSKEKGFYDSTFHLVTSQEEFCQMVDSYAYDRSTLYVFAHNIFFDLQVSGFFKYMGKLGWTLGFYYDEGLTYILSIRKDNKRIKCLSTTNYFGYGLKTLGEIVGRKKTEVDFEKSTRDEKIAYCRNDMMIVRESMGGYFRFILEHDMGNFAMTKSSQAFNAYRHRFMDYAIFIHNEKEVVELERLAYHGGRNECYFIGVLNQSRYTCLDINSMYPFIMSTQKLPTMLIGHGESVSIDELGNLLKDYSVIAEVEVDTDQPIYAMRVNNKLIYPVGRFQVYLCTGGLKAAIEKGHIIRVKRYAVYEQACLFTDYVNYFYELRNKYKESGNKIYAELCKHFMNSLYGKFGQKKPITVVKTDIKESDYWRDRIFDIDMMEWETYTKMFNQKWIERGEENGKNTIVAVPAHITEYGRLMLYDLIQKADPKYVMYCDTDAIIGTESIKETLFDELDETGIGKLKVEYTTEHLTIHGCKDYETDHDVTLKGVPKNADKLSDDVFKYMKFLGQASHLSKGVNDKFIVHPVMLTCKREYTKGVVGQHGKVSPISLADV